MAGDEKEIRWRSSEEQEKTKKKQARCGKGAGMKIKRMCKKARGKE